MISKYLLPHRLRNIGYILTLISSILGAMYLFWDIDPKCFFIGEKNDLLGGEYLFLRKSINFYDELLCIMLVIGQILIAFSKEKIEDEYTQYLRLDAFLWSVYANAILIIINSILFYDFLYISIMAIQMFSFLFIYILRFHFLMWKESRAV